MKSPSIENTLHGAPAKQLFRAIEHLINLEWPRTQSILNSSQKNAKSYPATHGNISLGRAAGARLYGMIGTVRINERLSPRTGILDQIKVMSPEFWANIQPDTNHQAEFRSGCNLIVEYFGQKVRTIRLVLAQSKVTGASTKAQAAKFNKKKLDVQLYAAGAGWNPKFKSMESTWQRFLDAAQILSGPIADRQYLIKVKDLQDNWMTAYATHVPQPANVMASFSFATMPQADSTEYNDLFTNFKADYEKITGKQFDAKTKSQSHKQAISSLDVKMCNYPPRGTSYDHTLSKTGSADKSNVRMRELITGMCSQMSKSKPITIHGNWKLDNVLPPQVGEGFVNGRVTSKTVYTFMQHHTLDSLTRCGWTLDEIKAVKTTCAAVASGELICHPSWFGRQTQLSHNIGVLKCARQIPHWTPDEASTDKILFSRITTRAREEQHEGKKGDKAIEKASILIDHYCDIHKTALGNPEIYFESMDRRIRAHPTPAVFSLENGIESFPDTLVDCLEHDDTLSDVERALKDVRLLSKREQMHNLATLAVYKGVLEFIIEVHRELPQHQIRILEWFNNIKNNAREANAEPDERQSPRKKRKTSKSRKK